jgi:hypothetical protein
MIAHAHTLRVVRRHDRRGRRAKYLRVGEVRVGGLPAGVGEAKDVEGGVAQHLLLPGALLQGQHLGHEREGGVGHPHPYRTVVLWKARRAHTHETRTHNMAHTHHHIYMRILAFTVGEG